MRKTFFLFLCLILLNALTSGWLREKGQLQDLSHLGVPVAYLKEAGLTTDEMRLYGRFWKDIRYFPIPLNSNDASDTASFTNTWMQPRNYGGKRKHEGCDIFGTKETPGYYPVISITDGVVEKIGWLPLGGYRIGVRSPGGGYFYYAHFSGYAKKWKEGDRIKAGEIMGFLGDTGYGEEGTSGKFPSHLHLGIYVETKEALEYGVNPYWVLKYLEKNKKNYAY